MGFVKVSKAQFSYAKQIIDMKILYILFSPLYRALSMELWECKTCDNILDEEDIRKGICAGHFVKKCYRVGLFKYIYFYFKYLYGKYYL